MSHLKDALKGDVEVTVSRGGIEWVTVTDVDGWFIDDRINGNQQTGYYIHAETKKRQFGISLSKAALEQILGFIYAREDKRVSE